MLLKQLRKLLRRLKRGLLLKNKILRLILLKRNNLLRLPNRPSRMLKRERESLRRPLLNGKNLQRSKKPNPRPKSLLPRLPPRRDRKSLRPRERETKQLMMLHLRLRPRRSGLLVWLQKRHIRLLKPLGELVKKSKLPSIRGKWLPEEVPSRKHSEMSGQLETLVFPICK